MKSSVPRRTPSNPGFALIVTLSLMILLTVIAVGLLTLSTISLRSSTAESANHVARANARLALMMALGELQKTAGLDKRVTVDASIYDGAANPNTVGVWQAWSPGYSIGKAYPYTQKNDQFLGWLTSSGYPTDMTKLDWAKTGTVADPVDLFTQESDGFLLRASKVAVQKGKPSSGALAWTVVQEATRAKVNVAGPEKTDRILNDELQAQARPNIHNSTNFKQPDGGWNTRASKVISLAQAKLDPDLTKATGTEQVSERGDFTTQGFGLLTDNYFGGLKTDMSLGFEMSDGDFKQDLWGKYKNPFRSASLSAATTYAPTSSNINSAYAGQRPLFKPVNGLRGDVKTSLTFDPASTQFNFPAAAVPTFDTLRSFYLTPYYLYKTSDGATIYERGMDSTAVKPIVVSGAKVWDPPGLTPPGNTTRTSYRPVLDRVLFLLSVGIGPGATAGTQEARLVFTPIITLWNPYNVALEIEGAIAYPWMDVPFQMDWTYYTGSTSQSFTGQAMSQMLGAQLTSYGHGRTVDPYFFASITADGSGNVTPGQNIRFKPGEVRVFAPASKVNVDYRAEAADRARTVYLKPVTDPSQLSTKGGLAAPTKNTKSGSGFSRAMTGADSVEVTVRINNGGNVNDYPLSIGLEDATRAKVANPTSATHGQSIADVQTVAYAKSGSSATMKSARYSYAELMNLANTQAPFGVIETYHRVASDTAVNRRSDLVFTTNPRQPFINRYLTAGTFQAGPHYETVARAIGSLSDAIKTNDGGRTAYYGVSNSPSGESALSFFEVPQAPMLSLAGFQHADISMTCYAPANQIGNSWASAYLAKNRVSESQPYVPPATSGDTVNVNRDPMAVYDYSYLANELLFDSFYFSGAAPTLQPGSATGSPNIWINNNRVASVSRTYKETLQAFIKDPVKNPLRNQRMKFHAGGETVDSLQSDLVKPEGCVKLAAHLYMDGAFNINSTSQKAWVAFLSGMRDLDFPVNGGSAPSGGKTAFPRFRNVIGSDSNNWMGFRSLNDSQIEQLATNIVAEVKLRGPFLTLGEFVNRRIDGASASTPMALRGAIQSAILNTTINDVAKYDAVNTVNYPAVSRTNIVPANTGVGIPGFLTQADVLQSIAPAMTARSDTFTIRGYGEARDVTGKVLAVARCEAVVQRTPEFVDSANSAYTPVADLNAINTIFGRKFAIISFRYLATNEVV